jgi:hypothetical protein
MQHSSTQKFATKRYVIKYVSGKIWPYDTALFYLHKYPFGDPSFGDTYAIRARISFVKGQLYEALKDYRTSLSV